MSVMPVSPLVRDYRGPLVTPLGKTWADRIRRSDRHYEEHKARYCYDELLRLYTAAYEMRTDWNANVSMGWSVLQNLVADSFFKNPEPVILPLTPEREEQARMATDMGRSWHDRAGTETTVMRARVLCGTQGGAVIWIEEEAEYQDAVALDDDGQPMTNTVASCVGCGTSRPMYPASGCASCGETDAVDTGAPVLDENGQPEPLYEYDRPMAEGGAVMKEAVRQDFTQKLIDIHGMRFDPDGMDWGWSDMKWVSRRYEKSLGDFLADDALSEETKARLRSWAKSRRRQRIEWSRGNDANEQDPALQMIQCDEIWSMVHGRIIHMPVGAEFHLEGATDETRDGFPMPEFWRKNRMYPGVMFAYNWHPSDADGRWGFYPIPDLYLVKSQLKNLIRLEGLILNLCTQQTTKYLYPDGLIDNKVQRRISSDVPREMIPVDIIGTLKRLVAAGVAVPSNLENLIINLKTEQREQLVKHFEAFEHEVNLIRETLSQGPSQRGGVPDSKTATGQLQVGQSLERRLDIESEITSGYIDKLTERYFLLLQWRQTLPVFYRGGGEAVNEETFHAFVVDQEFRSLRFHFSHRTGTARGIDRELLRQQIREAITNALPVVQDPVQIQTLLKKLFSTFDDPTLSRAFDNDLSSIAEQALVTIDGVENGSMPLDQAGPVLLELLSKFANAHLTKAGIERVAQQSAGKATQAPEMERRGSVAKPKSTGKRAFDAAAGMAAAGRVGGAGVAN